MSPKDSREESDRGETTRYLDTPEDVDKKPLIKTGETLASGPKLADASRVLRNVETLIARKGSHAKNTRTQKFACGHYRSSHAKLLKG